GRPGQFRHVDPNRLRTAEPAVPRLHDLDFEVLPGFVDAGVLLAEVRQILFLGRPDAGELQVDLCVAVVVDRPHPLGQAGPDALVVAATAGAFNLEREDVV